MNSKKYIKYTPEELAVIRLYIASTSKGSRTIKYGNGMAKIVARHGKPAVHQKVSKLRLEGKPKTSNYQKLVADMSGSRSLKDAGVDWVTRAIFILMLACTAMLGLWPVLFILKRY